jgi:hypothetical protein
MNAAAIAAALGGARREGRAWRCRPLHGRRTFLDRREPALANAANASSDGEAAPGDPAATKALMEARK